MRANASKPQTVLSGEQSKDRGSDPDAALPMTPLLSHLLDQTPLEERLLKYVSSLQPGQKGSLGGVAGSLTALLLSVVHQKTGISCLVVTPAREQAIRVADDLSLLVPGDQVRLF